MPESQRFFDFCDRLDALIDEERETPADDRLTNAEIVGALEFKKLTLMTEACAE